MPKKIKEENKKIPSIELYGLQNVFDNLKNLYIKKSFPKVLMLTGEKGIGKFTLCFHLINYFLSDGTEYTYNVEKRSINKKNTVFGSEYNEIALIDEKHNIQKTSKLKKIDIAKIVVAKIYEIHKIKNVKSFNRKSIKI